MQVALPAPTRLAKDHEGAARLAELLAAGTMQGQTASELTMTLLALRPPADMNRGFAVVDAIDNLRTLWDLAATLAAELDHCGTGTATWLAGYAPAGAGLGGGSPRCAPPCGP